MSIRVRLLLLILVATLIPVLVAGLQFLERRDSEIAAARLDLAAAAEQLAGDLQNAVRATAQLHYGLARARDLDTKDRAACSSFLADVLTEHRQYTGLLTITPDGALFCDSLRTGRELNLTDRRYFQDALRTKDPLAVEPVFGRLTGAAVLQIAYAVRRDTGETRFVLLASLDLEKYMRSRTGSLPRRTAVIALVDGKGTLLTWHPGGERLRGASIAGSPLFGFASDPQGGRVRENLESADGTPRMWATAGLAEFPAAGLYVLAGVSEQDLLAAANRNLRQALAILFAAWVLVFAGAWMLATAAMNRELSEAARIRELNEHLEHRVRERVADFESANLALKREVVEREQAEAAARASERQLSLVYNNVADIIFYLGVEPDGNYRFLSINPAFQKATGLVESQVVGRTVKEIIPEPSASLVLAKYREAIGTGQMASWEEESVYPTGIRHGVVSVTPVFDGQGRCTHLVGAVHDITDRKQAEAKIRDQLEHLNLLDHITRSTGERQDLKNIFGVVVRSLEDSLPIDFGCVCLHDAVANALTVSSVGVKSAALAHALTMDENASIGVDQNGLSRCVQGVLVYEADIGQSAFPFPKRLAGAGLRSLVLAPLKSESRVFGVLVAARREANAFTSGECEFLRQLSEHVALAAHQAQLYESLQRAYDDLRATQEAAMQEERLRAVGQMASGIAHDINNALSPVSLYTESLLETEKGLSAGARGKLETIQRAVEDVAQTVARMREFYRQREEQIELAPVDANQMVRQVLDLTKARWSDMAMRRGITIQSVTALAPDLPKIMAVESEIREALTNLVFNAADAMPEGGTLTVRTRLSGAAPDQVVVLEVTDTGIGMDEETRKRCLEPFFTTKGERGTGLGLAMVFGMVQRHSAGIEIDSAPGRGTTLRLAFAVPTAAIAEPGQPVAVLQARKHLRLLLADDDPVLINSLRDALQTDGHVITAANGGQAGIDQFLASLKGEARFDAVITDLGMPYVDGRKVAAAVKQAAPATPVILLTGWGQRMVADGDIPAHVDRVLAKPPKLRELREALAQLCAPEAGARGGGDQGSTPPKHSD